MNQISRQCGQLFALMPGEAIFDRKVLTLGKACVFQSLTDRGQKLKVVVWSPEGEEPVSSFSRGDVDAIAVWEPFTAAVPMPRNRKRQSIAAPAAGAA